MKISKFIAGMSAAAMLATVTTALPASAEEEVSVLDEGKTSVGITVVRDQWTDGLDATNVPWSVTKPWDVIQGYGEITVEVQVSNLETTLASGENLDFTDLTASFYGMDTTNWNWVNGGEATFDADGKATFIVDASTLNPKVGAEVMIGLQVRADDTKVAIDDQVNFDLEYSMTYIPVPEEEIVYELPQTLTDDSEYAGDWGGDGFVDYNRFKNLPEGKSLDVTMKYELLDDYDYHIAAPISQVNWFRLYSEGSRDWIEGVDLKSSFTKDDLEAHSQVVGTPVLQNDGYFIFYPSAGTEQEFTFTLTADAVERMKEDLEDEGYGGLGFHVYGVNITEVKVAEHKDPAAPTYSWTAFEMWSDLDWNPASNWNTVADGGHGVDAAINADNTHYTVSFGPAYYAEDGETVVYKKPSDDAEPIKWYGANVWRVDIVGLADAIGAGTNNYEKKDGSEVTAADRKQLAVDAGLKISNVTVFVDGKEFYKIPDDKLLYGDLESNGNIIIEIQNTYGKGTTDKNSEFFIKEFYDKAYDLEGSEVKVAFDIEGVPEEPEPVIEEPEPVIEEPEPLLFDLQHVNFHVSQDIFTYDGTPKTPKVEWVTYDGEMLTEGVDYYVEYLDNVNVGCGKVRIVGMGKYIESVGMEFEINEPDKQGYDYGHSTNPPTGGGGYENISNDLSKATVTGIKNKVYTGKAQTQNFTVRSGSYTLKKDYEYSVTYKNNTKVGTASVIIEGKGYFAGQKITKTFKITGKSLTKANVSGISNKVYTGKAIKPAPVVKLGKKTLKKGVDYTVSYKNNTKVGKATVTIKGKGAYTGTITKSFKINPKKTTIKKATSPKTRQLKVSYGKVKGVTGYQVKYSTSKKFTKKTTKTAAVKGAGKTSKTIKKLKKGKTYYVKVRAYKVVGGVKYYGAYSAVKKVKVK